MAPQKFRDLYQEEKIPLPPNFRAEHPFDNGELNVRDEKLAGFPREAEEIRQHIAAYYAMISHLDAQIGRVLDALEKSGSAGSTVVIFAGDNGLAVGQHGLMGKQNIYDHSVRVPLLMSGPGIPEGETRDSLCYLLDIFPTLCQMLRLPIPASVEGKSLLPVLKKRGAKVRTSVFLGYRKFQRGVRTEDNWKLIRYNVAGLETTQLFDLNGDPWETVNLEDSSGHSEKKRQLNELLKKHMSALDDFCSLNMPNWGLPVEKTTITKVGHLAVDKPVRLLNGASPEYSRNGAQALADGIKASSRFNDGHWLGLRGEDLDALIDLGRIQPITNVTVGFLENQESWIFLPSEIEWRLSSDSRNSISIKKVQIPLKKNIHTLIETFSGEAFGKEARYIRITAKVITKCPEWHVGVGEKAWVFCDEIVVE